MNIKSLVTYLKLIPLILFLSFVVWSLIMSFLILYYKRVSGKSFDLVINEYLSVEYRPYLYLSLFGLLLLFLFASIAAFKDD